MDGGQRPNGHRGSSVTASSVVPVSTSADFADGYVVPVDPMDDLQCESCQ